MIHVNWTQRESEADRVKRAADDVRKAKRAAARQYLADTDWYITRALDPSDGRPVPEDVLTARAQARKTASDEGDTP